MNHFWMPILDNELPLIRRIWPNTKTMRRDDGSWAVLVATSQSEAEAIAALQLVIAEEMADQPLHAHRSN